MPASLDNSPWQWVDRPEQLAAVIDTARRAGRVALDVEHHSRRSYLGITCLLQLSTGDCCFECVLTMLSHDDDDDETPLAWAGAKDFLIDALALHDCMHVLRGLLADPGIVKVTLFWWSLMLRQTIGYCLAPSIAQVLHGADNDLLWCQRDFHLYLVNVFDTEKACQAWQASRLWIAWHVT